MTSSMSLSLSLLEPPTVGVVGLGYVGLPLLLAFHAQGAAMVGLDIDPEKIERLKRGENYLEHLDPARIQALSEGAPVTLTTDYADLAQCDAVLICVPTPLDPARRPDLSYVEDTARAIGRHLRAGQLVVLESTTWPGTTREVVAPLLEEASGLKAEKDFYVAFSPEREDPGNPDHSTTTIPKVVGALSPAGLEQAIGLYGLIVQVVPVSTPEAAEMTKLLENIYRSVNIALVNELKVLCHRMKIDLNEVIAAAATKPFGFQPFYPGPGLGGHCIPIDPFYLAHAARRYDFTTRFIELAGEINTAMPAYVVERICGALNEKRRTLSGARLLLIGVAYKKNIGDDRESPAYKIMELLEAAGSGVDFHDPHVPVIGPTRRYPGYQGRASVPLTEEAVASYDAIVIVTDHDRIDYDLLGAQAALIIDTRGAMARVASPAAVIVSA